MLNQVDGTLTYGEHHEISSKTIESIKSVMKKKNLNFFIATGRSRSSMVRVTKGALSDLFGGENLTPGVFQQVQKIDFYKRKSINQLTYLCTGFNGLQPNRRSYLRKDFSPIHN